MHTTHERQAAVDHFLRAAERLCQQTEHEHARDLWKFLHTSGCYGEPRTAELGLISLQRTGSFATSPEPTQQPFLTIVPLYKEDVGNFGSTWDKLAAAEGRALYLPLAHCIVLRPEIAESDIVNGITLLHEVAHAERADREGRAGHPDSRGICNDLLLEERDLCVFEGELWRALGEHTFTLVLDHWIYWIQKKLRQEKKPVGKLFIGLSRYDTRLDAILGPAPSEGARTTRKLHFEIIANFEVVERSALLNKRGVQAAMLRSIYKRLNFTAKF